MSTSNELQKGVTFNTNVRTSNVHKINNVIETYSNINLLKPVSSVDMQIISNEDITVTNNISTYKRDLILQEEITITVTKDEDYLALLVIVLHVNNYFNRESER